MALSTSVPELAIPPPSSAVMLPVTSTRVSVRSPEFLKPPRPGRSLDAAVVRPTLPATAQIAKAVAEQATLITAGAVCAAQAYTAGGCGGALTGDSGKVDATAAFLTREKSTARRATGPAVIIIMTRVRTAPGAAGLPDPAAAGDRAVAAIIERAPALPGIIGARLLRTTTAVRGAGIATAAGLRRGAGATVERPTTSIADRVAIAVLGRTRGYGAALVVGITDIRAGRTAATPRADDPGGTDADASLAAIARQPTGQLRVRRSPTSSVSSIHSCSAV